MLDGVFEFNDKTCKEIMTSSKDTFLINIYDDINRFLDEIISLGYSSVPVYEDNIDNIVGVIYIKDLLAESRKVGFDNIDIKEIMQEPYFVPENKKTNELFKVLKEKKIHLAFLVDEYGGFSGIVTMEDLIEEIVGDIDDEYDIEEMNISQVDENIFIAFLVDEYGGFSGIVTMEDLIEEIVGDIDDEYDIEEMNISQVDENIFIAKGILPISEVRERFNKNIIIGNYDTLNGYLIANMGEVPKERKEIILDNQVDENIFIAKGILPISEVRERFNKNIIIGNYDTLNGYLIANMGEVPKERKEIILDNIKFEILKLGNRRIEEIKLTILK